MLDAQTISDRFEIDDLLTTYTMAIDSADWDALDRVFTPDAHIDYTASGGTAGPFPEVKAWLAEMLPMVSGMQHLLGQKRVEIDGDEAHVRAYFYNPMAMDQPDGTKWHLDIAGVYLHTLVRTEAGWRSRRLVEELLWERKPS